jgi:phosphoribosyl-ATP pyrophosphohydrolase
MASVAQAVSDLLEEYVADLSFLEQLVLCDGPIPLSQVLQHLQKASGTRFIALDRLTLF